MCDKFYIGIWIIFGKKGQHHFLGFYRRLSLVFVTSKLRPIFCVKETCWKRADRPFKNILKCILRIWISQKPSALSRRLTVI